MSQSFHTDFSATLRFFFFSGTSALRSELPILSKQVGFQSPATAAEFCPLLHFLDFYDPPLAPSNLENYQLWERSCLRQERSRREH